MTNYVTVVILTVRRSQFSTLTLDRITDWQANMVHPAIYFPKLLFHKHPY